MRVNRDRLDLCMARVCLNTASLANAAGLPVQTVNGARRGRNIRPATLGKISKALGVDPGDIIETEEKQ
ncbi:MAG TPA: helix-turn-helix transcriptional regulator [Candidatus Flavonifractor intestinipullorum]|uniref:Helix-turn-helix transcriptional regulator n=1 Tax=Candidatus Flavonifractor intestinipullorum TaxID=2838587 RepID=A0A9D2S5M7_9FIRM|nr:helix-turn-helix transcriptional regulator [Candidatus Flavonifractor intestinipullorum]